MLWRSGELHLLAPWRSCFRCTHHAPSSVQWVEPHINTNTNAWGSDTIYGQAWASEYWPVYLGHLSIPGEPEMTTWLNFTAQAASLSCQDHRISSSQTGIHHFNERGVKQFQSSKSGSSLCTGARGDSHFVWRCSTTYQCKIISKHMLLTQSQTWFKIFCARKCALNVFCRVTIQTSLCYQCNIDHSITCKQPIRPSLLSTPFVTF